MRRGWAVWAFTLAGLAGGLAATAQDPKPAGAAVPAGFRSFVVVDDRFPPKVSPPKRPEDRDPRDRTAKMHDLVVEHGLNPVAAVFARSVPKADDAPLARLVKQLDQLAAKQKGNTFGTYVIFLTLDKEYPEDEQRDARAQAVRDLAAQLKAPRVPFGLAAGKSAHTDAWKIAPEDDVTVVVYDKMGVVKRWAFKAGGPTDEEIKAVIAAADQAAGKP